MTQLREKLDRCLQRFGAVKVDSITSVYDYYPTIATAKLGSGSYGEAYRMKSVTNANEPTRVVKAIIKDRITRHILQIHHLCAELAVTALLKHENLNRRVGLYHDSNSVYIVLEMMEGQRPDVSTRLYHLFARYAKNRIGEVPSLVAHCSTTEEEDALVASVLHELGVEKEMPQQNDLFNTIVVNKKIPPRKALVILRQIMKGLEYLHSNQVVHRDMKTENLVLAENRKATPILDSDGVTVKGVRIEEKVSCRIIDFGLVKYLQMAQFPTSPSPGAFGSGAVDMFAGGGSLEQVNYQQAPMGGVQVTPCGTELYCSLEVIQGILSSSGGRYKWQSTRDTLPKFDVYGAGTMLYCMLCGRPPFRFTSYRQVTKEEKLRQISQMIRAGPTFPSTVSAEFQQLVRSCMSNDLTRRPTAAEVLGNPLLAGVTSTYAYEVMVDGTVVEVQGPEDEAPQRENTTEPAAVPGAEEEEINICDDDDALRLAMGIVRGDEDNGDGADKSDVSEETAADNKSA